MSKPTVPEVSLIFDDSKLSALKNEAQPKSYKEWKQQQQKSPKPQEPPINLIPNQTPTVDRKKIVTFDLPMEAHPDKKLLPQPVQSTPLSICQQLDLSVCEPKKNIINNARHSIPVNFMAEMQCKQKEYNGYAQHHHQNDKRMQMSNSSSPQDAYKRTQMQQSPAQMDFNQNSAPSKDVTLNEIYKLLQNMQVNSQTPASNKPYETNRLDVQNYGMQNHHQPQMNHMPLVTGHFDAPSNTQCLASGEPTMRDMVNVILRQQEQLFNIQNQVHMLLVRTANPPTNQLDSQAHSNHQNIHSNSNLNEMEAPTKHVGVMTSLEINVQKYNANAIRADENFNTSVPKNMLASNQQMKPCGCACNCNAAKSSQSSNSTDSNDDNFDTSPSQSDAQTGWTFYGNILDQVNDVLHNTPPGASAKQNENSSPNIGAANIENRYEYTNDNAAPRPNIRTAQFKQVGFQIDDVNISGMSKR